jgi:hypothetical protein
LSLTGHGASCGFALAPAGGRGRRRLLGTHQGAVRPQQLDYYLDEFTFRFNRRGSNHRGLLFHRLLEQAVQIDHIPRTASRRS